jgi:uncharacterized protein YcbX
MLCRVSEGGELEKIQLSRYPQCSLFTQKIVDDSIHVRYLIPKEPLVAPTPEQQSTLQVPLYPDLSKLDRANVNLHQSMVSAYRMGAPYDAWFSACFGFNTALIYIGDGKRPVLGSFSPKSQSSSAQGGWLTSISSLIPNLGGKSPDRDWLTFTDMAPFLVATEKSLQNVKTRLTDSDVGISAFRPNIVIDGDAQWDEDFWTGLSINDKPTLTMSKMCNRCASLNVDYDTGRVAEGERGTVLKKLMSDRRVDQGWKYAPVFGRYAFLAEGAVGAVVKIGDSVAVTGRLTERPVWDWPLNDKAAPHVY